MSLSKKHFEAIAKIINNNSFGNECLHLDNKRNLVNDFCNYFKTQNKNFNSFRFYNACMINEDVGKRAEDIEQGLYDLDELNITREASLAKKAIDDQKGGK